MQSENVLIADLPLQDRTHTLKSFASSADWIKSLHFGDPKPTTDPGVAAERSSKRRKLGTYTGPEPTVDEIEGEFWRVIEAPDDVRHAHLVCKHLHILVPQFCSCLLLTLMYAFGISTVSSVSELQ